MKVKKAAYPILPPSDPAGPRPSRFASLAGPSRLCETNYPPIVPQGTFALRAATGGHVTEWGKQLFRFKTTLSDE